MCPLVSAFAQASPSQTASRGPAQALDHILFFLGSESESDMIPVLRILNFAAGLFYGLTCLLEKICLNLLSIHFLFCPVRSGRMARSMEIDLYSRSYRPMPCCTPDALNAATSTL